MKIVDWIHSNVEYALGSTNPETAAYDTVTLKFKSSMTLFAAAAPEEPRFDAALE